MHPVIVEEVDTTHSDIELSDAIRLWNMHISYAFFPQRFTWWIGLWERAVDVCVYVGPYNWIVLSLYKADFSSQV